MHTLLGSKNWLCIVPYWTLNQFSSSQADLRLLLQSFQSKSTLSTLVTKCSCPWGLKTWKTMVADLAGCTWIVFMSETSGNPGNCDPRDNDCHVGAPSCSSSSFIYFIHAMKCWCPENDRRRRHYSIDRQYLQHLRLWLLTFLWWCLADVCRPGLP